MTKLIWEWEQCVYFWLCGELDEFRETYNRAIALGRESGVHVLDIMLHGQAAHCYLSYGKTEEVDVLLREIEANSIPGHTLHTSLNQETVRVAQSALAKTAMFRADMSESDAGLPCYR